MIPYFQQPSWQLGPLTIHAFGIAVAFAMWVGLTLAQRRWERVGLDPMVGNRLGTWVLVGGLLGAHLFAVLFYAPEGLRADPWVLLRVWEPISSFGGMLGGIAAGLLFFAIVPPVVDWGTRLRYADVIAFVFAPALAIGRVGCALAHDHPGVVTHFPLAVSLENPDALVYLRGAYETAGLAFPASAEGMGFHDLGLYEALFVGLLIVPLFVGWGQRPKPVGFFLAAFAALYLPVRFGFDMLRVVDSRYLNLTPAQWVAALGLVVLPLAAMRHRKVRFAIAGAVILGTALACRGG